MGAPRRLAFEVGTLMKKEPLRVRKAAKTRATIIASAYSLFGKQGFDSTTLEQIADLSDVHKQTVLRYFNTKEDIALAARIELTKNFEVELESPDRDQTAMEYWRRFCIEAAKTIAADRGSYYGSQEFIDSDPRLAARALAVESRFEAALARAFAREAGNEPENDIFATMLATFVVSASRNVAAVALAQSNTTPVELTRAVLAVVDFAKSFDRKAFQNLLDRNIELDEPPAPQRRRTRA